MSSACIQTVFYETEAGESISCFITGKQNTSFLNLFFLQIVVEYQQNLGTDAQEESRRIDVLIDKLTNLEKELSKTT